MDLMTFVQGEKDNPRKRRAKRRKKGVRRRRRNPATAVARPATRTIVRRVNVPAKRTNRRKSNPSVLARGDMKTLLAAALVGVGGAYATRWLPRVALQGKDTGALGYAANVGTALGLGAAAKATGLRKYAPVLTLGGFMATLLRGLENRLAAGQFPGFADYVQIPPGMSDYVGVQGLGFLEEDFPGGGNRGGVAGLGAHPKACFDYYKMGLEPRWASYWFNECMCARGFGGNCE